jgi:hypothetical protein
VRNGGAIGVDFVAQQGPSVDADSPRYTSQVRTKEDVFFEQKQKMDKGAGLKTNVLGQNINSF